MVLAHPRRRVRWLARPVKSASAAIDHNRPSPRPPVLVPPTPAPTAPSPTPTPASRVGPPRAAPPLALSHRALPSLTLPSSIPSWPLVTAPPAPVCPAMPRGPLATLRGGTGASCGGMGGGWSCCPGVGGRLSGRRAGGHQGLFLRPALLLALTVAISAPRTLCFLAVVCPERIKTSSVQSEVEMARAP